MKTKRSTYLAACMNQPIEWLISSAANPSQYMTRMHVILHHVAIRRLGGL